MQWNRDQSVGRRLSSPADALKQHITQNPARDEVGLELEARHKLPDRKFIPAGGQNSFTGRLAALASPADDGLRIVEGQPTYNTGSLTQWQLPSAWCTKIARAVLQTADNASAGKAKIQRSVNPAPYRGLTALRTIHILHCPERNHCRRAV